MRHQDLARSQRAYLARTRTRNGRNVLPVALALVIALAACGGEPPAQPTVTVEVPTMEAQLPTSTSSALAERVTLDELFSRIQAGWADETQFREMTTFTPGGPSPATPASATAGTTGRTLREVFGPGRVRNAAEENGQLLYEIVIDGDEVYLRGTIATLIDPTLPSGEWLRTDQATVAAQPQLGASLLDPLLLDTPTYHPPDRVLPQVVRLIGPTDDGCVAYAAADTTATGARIDFTIAVQPDGSLCRIETRSPGLASIYQVEPLSADASLALPTSYRVATPVSGTPGVALPSSD